MSGRRVYKKQPEAVTGREQRSGGRGRREEGGCGEREQTKAERIWI